ncbi:hypothetical protein Pelo_12513 [Pelomyxa schiedti]|nr:hypothetical protein Pelo_12513 [Pelomyxa schiedti]
MQGLGRRRAHAFYDGRMRRDFQRYPNVEDSARGVKSVRERLRDLLAQANIAPNGGWALDIALRPVGVAHDPVGQGAVSVDPSLPLLRTLALLGCCPAGAARRSPGRGVVTPDVLVVVAEYLLCCCEDFEPYHGISPFLKKLGVPVCHYCKESMEGHLLSRNRERAIYILRTQWRTLSDPLPLSWEHMILLATTQDDEEHCFQALQDSVHVASTKPPKQWWKAAAGHFANLQGTPHNHWGDERDHRTLVTWALYHASATGKLAALAGLIRGLATIDEVEPRVWATAAGGLLELNSAEAWRSLLRVRPGLLTAGRAPLLLCAAAAAPPGVLRVLLQAAPTPPRLLLTDLSYFGAGPSRRGGAMHVLCCGGQQRLIKKCRILAEAGLDPHALTDRGENLLHCLLQNLTARHPDPAGVREFAEWLISTHGLDMRAPDASGRPAWRVEQPDFPEEHRAWVQTFQS